MQVLIHVAERPSTHTHSSSDREVNRSYNTGREMSERATQSAFLRQGVLNANDWVGKGGRESCEDDESPCLQERTMKISS